MTNWTPQLRVYVNGTLYSGYVDFSMTWGQSRNSPWELPTPGSGAITFLLTSDTGTSPVKYRDKIRLDTYDGSTWQTSFTGLVDEITVAYRGKGSGGTVVDLTATLIGATSTIINSKWNSSGVAQSSAAAITELMAYAGALAWNEWDPSDTWQMVPSTWTWANMQSNAFLQQLINGYQIVDNSAGGYQVQVPAGERDCWQDLQALVLGAHGTMYEDSTGKIIIRIGDGPSVSLSQVDLQSNIVELDVAATIGGGQVTNLVSVAYTGGTYDSSDPLSVYTYGEQSGSLTTYLTSSSDAQTIATLISFGLSWPSTYVQQCSVDLMNSAMLDLTRMWLSTLGVFGFTAAIVPDVPALLGGQQSHLLLGYRREISRDTYRVSMDLAPYSSFYNKTVWAQVPPSFTWTSYGTAYPTRKWSDA